MNNNPFALDAEYEVKNLQLKNNPVAMNGYMINSLVGTSNKDARGKLEAGEETVIVFEGGEEKYEIKLIKAGTPKEEETEGAETPADPMGDAILGKDKRSAEDLEKLKGIAVKVGHSHPPIIGFDKLNTRLLEVLLPLAKQLEIENDLENLDAIQVFEIIEAKKAAAQ